MEARARQLIEALGWEIKRDTPTYVAIDTRGNAYDLASGGWGDAPNHTYEQAAKAYDKLAEQAQMVDDIFMCLSGHKPVISGVSRDLASAAAELRAMAKEPTLLERLESERVHLKREPGNRMGMAFDALIELYRAHLERKGKE